MIDIDVDTAVVLPLNAFPLLDDTDFKTIETGLVYNSAGLVINWNFVTTAGVMTTNAITATTGGVFDITEPLADKGLYAIEMPASGQTAGSNNDREGFGWFTGVATGILPWSSPMFRFRDAGLNNALTDSAWSATRGLAGTALPAAAADAAGGLVISDAGGLDIDATSTRVILALPAVAPDANGGLPLTNGTKLNKTVDLTAGQTVAATVADKTGYSLAATGLDLVTAASTFGAALIAGIWAAATSGLTTAGSIGKKLADWTILTSQAIRDALKLDASAGAPATGSIDKHVDDLLTGQALQAVDSTVAKEGTLNTKIPANLSFTGANVNAESKVTAAPTGMSTLTAGAQMDLVNAPNATAVTAIQLGLSKPGTAQTITAPADMASNALLTAVAGYIDTEVTAIKNKTDNLPLSPAAVGSEMVLSAAYDPAKTAAQDSTVAKAATALSTAVWTGTKAGYLDAAISGVIAPTAGEIDTQLSNTHGSGTWGAGVGGSNTITITTALSTGVRIPQADIDIKNISGTAVASGKTDANGAVSLDVGSAAYTLHAVKPGYNFSPVPWTVPTDGLTIPLTGSLATLAVANRKTTTVMDIVKRALRLLSVAATGESPESPEAKDALSVLNAMIDQWNNDKLALYAMKNELFAVTANVGSYQIGVGAAWDTTRPTKIEGMFVRDTDNIDYKIELLNNQQYQEICQKSLSSSYPRYAYYSPELVPGDGDAHLYGTVYLWPVPVVAYTAGVSQWSLLSAFTGLTQNIVLPPGYEMALGYGLAYNIAPEYGIDPGKYYKQMMDAKADVARVNTEVLLLTSDASAVAQRGGYNIYTDE